MRRFFPLLLAGVLLAAPVVADTPAQDPIEESRAQALFLELRCVTCQNEPISQSSSDMAGDMRQTVRGLITEGRTDSEIRGYFRERYGDFVVFRPEVSALTIMLWAAPVFMLMAGLALILNMRRRVRETDLEDDPVSE
jgi:cytochrome c-type biogenesis protein CcmH